MHSHEHLQFIFAFLVNCIKHVYGLGPVAVLGKNIWGEGETWPLIIWEAKRNYYRTN